MIRRSVSRRCGAQVGLLLVGLTVSLQAGVVINEIHYDPDVKTEPVEFIELYNPDTATVDLSGWSLVEAVDYTFPAGTQISPGAYLVIAQNPTALTNKFAVSTPLGPWVGQLANEGERISLRNAVGQAVDEVNYQLGFPWPTVGDPPGYSIELVHPSLDNDLGGSWRRSVVGDPATQSQVLIPDHWRWRYFKGTREASTPTTAWRDLSFNDTGWSNGLAPIGYDPAIAMGTTLSDMRGYYTTVFFRSTFVVTNRDEITALTLQALYDDGFKVWINSSNVLNLNISTSEVPYNGTASSAREDGSYNTSALNSPPPRTYLLPGTNVIAIQAANSGLTNSSDFYLDVRLLATVGPTGRGPTPGARNSVYDTTLPPQIRQVDHDPRQPRSGEPVRISAKITDPDGVAGVKLLYQVVPPGAYIGLTTPAYSNNWTELAMNDAGLSGDALAGDSVYTVALPASLQTHRRLIRYRLRATDPLGKAITVPYGDDPQPNFAYFVYDSAPAWTGAIQPGVAGPNGVAFTVTSNAMNRWPIYHLISQRESVEYATGWRLAGNSGGLSNRYTGDLYTWEGALVYDGRVYDHIRYRARGGVWRYSMVKNMWKIDLNRGHDFQARDDWGRKYAVPWRKVNLGACIQQGDYQHRGEQGMFEAVGFRLFQLAGVAAPLTTFVQFRIIDDALEVDPTTQYEGDFWGLYLATEQEDGRFLEAHDLPDSNFYKMEGGTGELNNLGPNGPTDKSDLNYVLNNYSSASDAWWRANWNLLNYYSYQAIVQAIHHFDISDNKNYFYFTNSNTGRWEIMPWDLDLAWAHNMYRSDINGAGVDRLAERILNPYKEGGVGVQTGTGVMRLSGTRPVFEIEFRNRLREIRNLLFNSDQGFALIDECAQLLGYPSATPGLLEADRAQWDYNPKMADGAYTPNLGKAGQGRFYQFPLESGTNAALRGSFAATVQIMKNYVNIRASLLDDLASDPSIPSPSSVTYIGPAGYPLNRLQFRSSAYVGTQSFAAMKWRIAEVTDPSAPAYDPAEPRAYEMTPSWESADLTAFSSEVTIPVEAVRVGHAYRVRVRMQDATGRRSAWSAPVQFVVGPPDQAAAMRGYLRLTELMYQPPGGSDYEFIELCNTSTNLTLDLAGAKFTSGVDFTFPAGTVIPPGGYRLVVGTTNLAAFRAYYGLDAAVAISGPYGGSLNNGGEQLTLKTAAGDAEIAAFQYADGMASTQGRGWPVVAAGAGHSLVPLDRAAGGQASGALDYPGNWRASTYIKGSPGRADPPPPAASVVLNEIAAHTDYYHPARPEYDSNDWLELYNAGTASVTLTGWYLSDDPVDLKKWQIPAVTLNAYGRLSFDEISGFHTPITSGFGLNKAGEQVLLSYLPGNTGDRVVDAVRFEGQENGVAWGRYPDGAWLGDTLNQTRDAANTAPLRSVVINEVMYCPPSTNVLTDNLSDEYLELWNPTTQPVDLFTTTGAWRIDGGVRYTFPPQTRLPPGATMVLVSFDPADGTELNRFRQAYSLTNAAITFAGPYAGKLGNRSDRLGLERPQAPDLPGDPYSWVIVDEVIYGNQNPWPATARSGGHSLHRLAVGGNGNDPDNWLAAAPSPGAAGSPDSDGDGLPDTWEDQYQLNPRDPSDAPLDPDGDGLTNLQEYRAGTNPRDASSVLRFESVQALGGEVILRFRAVAGHTYSVLCRDDPWAGPWVGLRNIDAGSSNGLWTVSDVLATSKASRSYRLVTPAVP